MPLKKDVLQLTSIFVVLITLLIFGGYFLFQGAFFFGIGIIFLGSIIPLFIAMVMKGKSMKGEYPEEHK